jgi:hypothetical protein
MSTEETFDAFLSHSHADAELVEGLAQRLEDHHDFHVWLDRWVLVAGENWQPAMARGLRNSRVCVVCIGEHTPSGWFHEEIQRALNRQTQDSTFRVIPVLLPGAQEVNVDDFLELRTWVDLRDGLDNAHAFHVLVSGIQGVAPGRGPVDEEVEDPTHVQVRDRLAKLKELRHEQLVDDNIVQEYQRRLLDRLVEF